MSPIEVKKMPEMFGQDQPQNKKRSPKLYAAVLLPALAIGIGAFGLTRGGGEDAAPLQANLQETVSTETEISAEDLDSSKEDILTAIDALIVSYHADVGVYPALQNINRLIDDANFIGGFPEDESGIVYGVYDLNGRQSDYSLSIMLSDGEFVFSSFNTEEEDTRSLDGQRVTIEEPQKPGPKPKR
jgi:hypothetical protein